MKFKTINLRVKTSQINYNMKVQNHKEKPKIDFEKKKQNRSRCLKFTYPFLSFHSTLTLIRCIFQHES